jgi:hypothetical protein
MMGTTKALTFQQGVSVAGEIAISKEKQAHDVERQLGRRRRAQIYVSHVDIFELR